MWRCGTLFVICFSCAKPSHIQQFPLFGIQRATVSAAGMLPGLVSSIFAHLAFCRHFLDLVIFHWVRWREGANILHSNKLERSISALSCCRPHMKIAASVSMPRIGWLQLGCRLAVSVSVCSVACWWLPSLCPSLFCPLLVLTLASLWLPRFPAGHP